MKIIRVFPTRTTATPDDNMVYFGEPTLFSEADEVHVSTIFTWDIPKAEYLAKQWNRIAPVKIGGPAFNERSEQFKPGLYVKHGYTITSRGCPNKCWFCSVWRREGSVTRELEIKDGYNILDDNLLACSEGHIRKVFDMLKRQKKPAEFTGGLEAARFKDWHIDLLLSIRLKQMFFAYDTPDDYEPLLIVSHKLKDAGIIKKTSHASRCYVLIGYPRDCFNNAEQRLKDVLDLGFTPMAMLWKNEKGETEKEWRKFQRKWARPNIIHRLTC